MTYQRLNIYKHLNMTRQYNIPIDYNLVHGETKVLMNDNTYINIKDIKLGDILHSNNHVLGIITQHVNNIDIIKYYDNYYTASNIIYYNNKWKCLDMVINKHQLSNYSGVMYNIITESGTFNTQYFMFRDYLELHSVDIYNNVRRLTLEILNNEK